MSVISMKQLLEAGVHFGHLTRRWNPKMAPYIYTERNGIYIIDLQKSVGMIDDAYKAGYFKGLFTTNLIYQPAELLTKPYYHSCDLSKYIALIIDTLNHDSSISSLLEPSGRIQKILRKYANHEKI